MRQNGEKPRRNFFLHCDECHYEVNFEGKMNRSHIGARCPLCNADMLTEADYKVGARIQAVHSFFIFLGLMKPATADTKPGPNEVLQRTHYHNGKLTITDRGE